MNIGKSSLARHFAFCILHFALAAAASAAMAAPTIAIDKVAQRWPWNNKVDITYTTTGNGFDWCLDCAGRPDMKDAPDPWTPYSAGSGHMCQFGPRWSAGAESDAGTKLSQHYVGNNECGNLITVTNRMAASGDFALHVTGMGDMENAKTGYYRLKFADTYYGEMTHYGLYRLAWADVRRTRD